MMVKLISFEGCVGAGKTSLTNYFSHELKVRKLLEEYERNPFLKDFYEMDFTVNLETEITFLLIHHSQLKKTINVYQDDFIIADFTIEKDLIYARLNLNEDELKIFEDIYDYVIKKVGLPSAVIYIDLSVKILRRRIFQRGRSYEMDADPAYFKTYNDKIKRYFENETQSKVYFFDVDDLDLDPSNEKLGQIRDIILKEIETVGKRK